ncbi:M20/M25/M40 family metallo-hydrolase [Sphingomonas sp. AOB5]|uniref:M20/M25/M40 family metallo-hydrolase n=1 Tax=Sphingomonas sp. AOB5 TaxID=3034017 RepID=UPI0023F78495|nr:M20/M25/M40 family metallo-hydrolase [Sphingomonas sp. AOB5]MDF7776261.1 M20/M25/M40 family metallo-hydrolase [Sphingomonas sp. AOB5]
MRALISYAVAASLILPAPLAAQTAPAAQPAAQTPLDRIIDEGSNRSNVMPIAAWLTDRIGSRLTNSPGMRAAEAWTLGQFTGWGLTNVHREGFDFGRGWWIERSSVRMVSPRPIQLTAIPITWTPATNGTITAPVIVAPIREASDFEAWRGKLKGKVVLITRPNEGSEPREAPFKRWTANELSTFDSYRKPSYNPRSTEREIARLSYPRQLSDFLVSEGAVAYATMSPRDGKLVHGSGYQFGVGDTIALPGIEIAAEDYRRLARLEAGGAAPTLEINSDVRFDDSDTKAYNIIADIKGTSRSGEYVMAGAHMDSWAAGDGAADNAAGVAMVMEAARILSKMPKPKRTIRFALWAGEEQGLLGSIDYVERHIATRAAPATPQTGLAKYTGWMYRWPITPLAGHSKLAAYFNLDNGSGRIRGINVQGNADVVPIFKEWFAPFLAADPSMGAMVAMRGVGGTDHVFFDAVGIPAFQFIQDPLDYGSRLHHTSVDTFDHLKAGDMRQGATILAVFLWNAANSDKPLPRMPIPTEPKADS